MPALKRSILWLLPLLGGILIGLAACWTLAPSGPGPQGLPSAPPSGEGWIDLLEPARRAGWQNVTDDKEIFEFQDDMLHIFGRTVYPLRYVGYTTEQFGDFKLHVEFKLAGGANSGVFLRAQPEDPVHRGFEVQVLEDHGKAPNNTGSGAIYDVVTPMFNMARPAGEWNSYDITLRGGEVIVEMNGWKVVHTDLSKMTMPIGKFDAPLSDLPAQGLLMFQDHGGEVWYRNVYVKKL